MPTPPPPTATTTPHRGDHPRRPPRAGLEPGRRRRVRRRLRRRQRLRRHPRRAPRRPGRHRRRPPGHLRLDLRRQHRPLQLDRARRIAPGCIVAVVHATLDAPHGPLQGINHARFTLTITGQGDQWGSRPSTTPCSHQRPDAVGGDGRFGSGRGSMARSVAASMAASTAIGVSGWRVRRAPRWATASATALSTAGGEPIARPRPCPCPTGVLLARVSSGRTRSRDLGRGGER